MNKLMKFYVYIGMLRHIGTECHGMYCYKQYKYRKWHPLVWFMLIIGAMMEMIRALIEMVQDLRNGALDETVELPIKNTIRNKQ